MAVSCSVSHFNHNRLLYLRSKSPLLNSSLPLNRPLLPSIRLSASQSENENSNPNPTNQDQALQSETESEEKTPDSLSEVASELKQMLKDRKDKEKQEDNLLTGVGEEVREIEWPNLGKVVGTTGVVLAVIAGSTAALLSVNALLAEISDKVFAGKGIQDFF